MTCFKCDRDFRSTMADAIRTGDAKAMRNMAMFADKQLAALTPRSDLVGPLVDWPALRESWARDAETLRRAMGQMGAA